MQAETFSHTQLELLKAIYPPVGVIHVGVGNGHNLPHYTTAQTQHLLLVDANPVYIEYHQENNPNTYHSYSVIHACLSDHIGEAEFHLTSLPKENGLLAEEVLSSIWRNLEVFGTQQITTQTLDMVITEHTSSTSSYNWLVIDCLPALPVIQGAIQQLVHTDVLVVRELANERTSTCHTSHSDAIKHMLTRNGWWCIATKPERTPGLSKAFYIKDWKRISSTYSNDLTTRAHEIQQLRTQYESELAVLSSLITQQRDNFARYEIDYQSKLEQAIATRDEAIKLADECLPQIEQLTKARNEQQQLATSHQIAMQNVTQERDDTIRKLTECQASLKQAISARDEQATLAANRQTQLEQAHKAKEAQAKLAEERQTRIQQLEASIPEMEERQRLMAEEMSRAEGQIDLIKDVLLREPGGL